MLRPEKTKLPQLLYLLIPPIAITLLLWLTSNNDVSLLQGTVSLILLLIPWSLYCAWKRGNKSSLPVLSLITFMYWLYYVLPLYGGDITEVELWAINRELSSTAISEAIVFVLMGVTVLVLGKKCRIGQRLSPRSLPQIEFKGSRWNYIRVILCVGGMLSLSDSIPYAFGEGSRQLILILQVTLPTVAFAILFRNFLQGRANRVDKILIVGFLAVRLIAGMSSGWLGSLASIIVVCAAVYIEEFKKIPRLAVTLIIVGILFFQAGKKEFRNEYWGTEERGGKIERVTFWIDTSLDKWVKAIDAPPGDSVKDLTYLSLSRMSLLTQTANVLELTPSVVPYQYGRLYSYMLVTFIPRFVWPDKPSINEANQFYQVAYGVSVEGALSSVSMSVGALTEGYINFGWLGAALAMFLVGIFLDFFQNTFLEDRVGVLMKSIGITLIPSLLAIESQLAVYLGGIAQQVLIVLLVFLPIMSFRRTQK